MGLLLFLKENLHQYTNNFLVKRIINTAEIRHFDPPDPGPWGCHVIFWHLTLFGGDFTQFAKLKSTFRRDWLSRPAQIPFVDAKCRHTSIPPFQSANTLPTNRTCLCSCQRFRQLFRVGKFVSDVWTIGKHLFSTFNQRKHALYSRNLFEWHLSKWRTQFKRNILFLNVNL